MKRIKPPPLTPGDCVGLIAPAFFVTDEIITDTLDKLNALGLQAKCGAAVKARYGYLAGQDQQRADDIHNFFKDSKIKAIIALTGGWGCARLLDRLDYDLIAAHPKIVMGLSDITALLLGIYTQTGLICFHGLTGRSPWNDFNLKSLTAALFGNQAIRYENPVEKKISTITSGCVTGTLIGGNLSVLTALIGSKYLPSFKNALLFLEDVGEEVYRIDRMLTQLKLAGILSQLNGIILGQFTHHTPKLARTKQHSLSLQEVFSDHLKPLNIPCFSGAQIGHEQFNHTLPIGITAEMDADSGMITTHESATTT